MCVKRLFPQHVVARDGEGSLRRLLDGIGNIPGNPGVPFPFDPFTLFESGEIIIPGVSRICVQVVGGGRDQCFDSQIRSRIVKRFRAHSALSPERINSWANL